jgi:hypothetical protein
MLALLIDENLNHRILRGLNRRIPHLDYAVAQAAGLKGVQDPPLLAWAASHGRILVTHDLRSIPKHAYERIRAGHSMAGVIAVPDTLPIGQAIEDLELLVQCAQPAELENRVFYLPIEGLDMKAHATGASIWAAGNLVERLRTLTTR